MKFILSPSVAFQWLPLIEKSNSYKYIDRWFQYLNENLCKILGFVIMPNHFHGIFYVESKCKYTLNTIVSNGKRFWAYEMVRNLEEKNQYGLLEYLSNSTSKKEKTKGKKHQLFRPSFDSKICYNKNILEQKLDYIHHNPVSGKWNLVDDYRNFKYSTAGFYEFDKKNDLITNYLDVY